MRTKHLFRFAAATLALLTAGAAAASAATATEPSTRPAGAAVTQPAEAKKISIGQAAILGVVEGLTEYLPVSSTGHMILTSHLMGLSDENPPTGVKSESPRTNSKEGLDAFEIVIQLGAILAVLGLYHRRVGQMARGIAGKNPDGLRLLSLLMLAFLPAAVIGLIFHKKIEEHLFGPMPVAWALVVGGVLMIVVEHFFWRRRGDIKRVDQVDRVMYWQALVIGAAQCLAMWPGTSRSMITILAALVVGLDMLAAAEFSFLLALPTLGAATVYSGYNSWHALMSSAGLDGLLIGLVISGVVAAVAVKAFVKWLTRHGLMPFGVYRIILGVAVYWMLAR